MAQFNRYGLDDITVLVVDDNPANRKLAAFALGDCKILEASDGAAALELLHTHEEIDIALLDVMMPGISGYEVCQKIKENARWRLIPVVMVTALTSVESRVNALRAGADDFISKPYDVMELQARVYNSARAKRYYGQLEDTENILFSLAKTVEEKDGHTEGHLRRIERLTDLFCHRLGLNDQMKQHIRYGGLLHDIGKVAVSDTILSKPGKLTLEEFEAIKLHTVAGYNIVSPLRMGKQVAPIVRSHHERWDGSGYPDGLKGEEIPFGARVIAICDVYDALTSDRPYRSSIPVAEALAYIVNLSEVHFDPALVPLFAQLVQDYR